MIEQGLFKRHFVGRDGFIWWIGQVVSEEKWAGNIPGRRTPTIGDHKGFGERFKVRIMGYHTADKKQLTDDQLPWASVMYPVTAGGGGGGTWTNAAIRQGNFVFGFFLDGEDAQQPVIMGVIGYNQYTSFSNQDNPDAAFFPFGGFSTNDVVPRYSIKTNPEDLPATQSGATQTSNRVTQQNVGGETKDPASKEQYERGAVKTPLPLPSTCEKVPLSKIQREIKNLIADIETIRKTASDWETKVSTTIGNVQNAISYYSNLDNIIQIRINGASMGITSAVRYLINEAQKYITRKINSGFKEAYNLLFPDTRATAKIAIEKANDTIACIFKKIVKNLFKMVLNFLLSAVDRFINTPLCAVENFVAALIGKISGLINSSVSKVLGEVSSIIGQAFDIADGVLDFITDIISFLLCEEQPSCAQIKEWSTWEGGVPSIPFNPSSIVNKVKTFASSVTQVVDPDNFDFDFDFSDVFEDTCNVGPVFCGPPEVQFYGGGGVGVSGNAIISAAGDILGVDIVNSGSGYSSPPIVSFVDNCGKGRGAVGRAIIGVVTTTSGIGTTSVGIATTTIGVVQVIIDRSGSGYLSVSDGDRGGDGRIWATREQTTVKRSDGRYDVPYNPEETILVNPGDEVYSCGITTIITTNQTIIAPRCTQTTPTREESPSSSTGQYPVILELTDTSIQNPGINYDPEKDKIIVKPDNGTVLKPTFDSLGSLIRIDVIKTGIGFTEVPNITIQSQTGFNAKIVPVFSVNRSIKVLQQVQTQQNISMVDQQGLPVSDQQIISMVDQQGLPVSDQQIISVVDCVGKV